MITGRSAGTAGRTRVCPHCKATILESAPICPQCRHHLKFGAAAAPAGQDKPESFSALRVEGTVQHPERGGDWEYSVVLSIRNEHGEELKRKEDGEGGSRRASGLPSSITCCQNNSLQACGPCRDRRAVRDYAVRDEPRRVCAVGIYGVVRGAGLCQPAAHSAEPTRGEITDMCLAVPMRIKSVDGFAAVCEAKGIEREVSLFMMQGEDVAAGDHVLVHVGYAIQKVSEEEARLTWDLFDEIVEHA